MKVEKKAQIPRNQNYPRRKFIDVIISIVCKTVLWAVRGEPGGHFCASKQQQDTPRIEINHE